MKKKYSLRKSIVCITSLILLLGNIILVINSISMALDGFEIYVEEILLLNSIDFQIDIQVLKIELMVYGVIIGLITSFIGSMLINHVCLKILNPLYSLTNHIKKVDAENTISQLQVSSKIIEIDSLITAYNSMSKKLQDTFQMQKNFSMYIAHEFRTPLAIMQTEIDVYEKNSKDKQMEIFTSLSNQISKLNMLITSIFNFTKINREECKDLIPIDILIDEVFEDLENEAQNKNISLISEINTNKKYEVIGNHTLLYQAFFNLIHNSIKYIDNNSTIKINVNDNNENIKITIQDNGIGIPKADGENIFSHLYRCNNTSNISGNGIGLAFTKKVFEHHKGNIKYIPTDIGTCFEITLHKYQGEKL